MAVADQQRSACTAAASSNSRFGPALACSAIGLTGFREPPENMKGDIRLGLFILMGPGSWKVNMMIS